MYIPGRINPGSLELANLGLILVCPNISKFGNKTEIDNRTAQVKALKRYA